MSRLLSSAVSLRGDPRLLKLPPYLSFLCFAVGIVWLLLLPLDEHSRRTYISENALLPGQVHTYFGGSEQHIFRAYRHEIDALVGKSNHEVNDQLVIILNDVGLKVGRQNYTYHIAGEQHSGENVYGILRAPRGDATEAIVLVAAWRSIDGQLNRNGVALALTLSRYFKRWSLWSKDIILTIPPDSKMGTQAWVDAYHDAHNSDYVAPLPIKSGALQGAVALDYPCDRRYEQLHIIYDGTNGQLPNLDLINSIVSIGGGQMGIDTIVQGMARHSNSYEDRLRTILRSMLNQGLGLAKGPHSSFIPYHVDAVTLQPTGEGWHDEMAMGRVIEGTFRSLNNLLEHLHQSFFFYLLMQRDRFVSIGTYLPSAMLLAANFSIMAIFLWVKSGQQQSSLSSAKRIQGINESSKDDQRANDLSPSARSEKETGNNEKSKGKSSAPDPPPSAPSAERDILLPLATVIFCQSLSAVPLFLFNNLSSPLLAPAFFIFFIISTALPLFVSNILTSLSKPTTQHFQMIKSFSLLLLGMCLATLATLNYSLAFLVGLLASPLSFVRPIKSSFVRWPSAGLLLVISPPVVILAAAQVWGFSITEVLVELSFGWNVWGVYTPVVIWCLWWPAWQIGMINALSTVTA